MKTFSELRTPSPDENRPEMRGQHRADHNRELDEPVEVFPVVREEQNHPKTKENRADSDENKPPPVDSFGDRVARAKLLDLLPLQKSLAFEIPKFLMKPFNVIHDQRARFEER